MTQAANLSSLLSGTTLSIDSANVASLSYTGTLTGSTGVLNIGSGQIYKDASGNVGIGTSSPGARLDAQTTAQAIANLSSSNANGGYITLGRTSAAAVLGSYKAASGGGSTINADALFFRNDNGIGFGSGGASVSAFLDSSGNLGLGVTPSGWSSNIAIQMGGGSIYSYSGNDRIAITKNAYFQGGAAYYKNTDTASNYMQYGGQHQWYTAPSGTSGTAISFTQAMTLDASGNLGIGTTSFYDSSKVQIAGAKTLSAGIPQQQLNIADTSSIAAGVGGAISFSAQYTAGSYTTMGSVEGVRENATSGNYAGALIFKTRANGGSNDERARIDSSGNVGIGKTPGLKFDVAGRIKGQGYNRYATWSGLVNQPGAFLFNLVTYSGTGQTQGKLIVRGNENSINGSYAEYFFIVTYAPWIPTYNVKLVQVGRASVGNSYGDIYLYLDNYSSDKYNSTQGHAGSTSAVANINVTSGAGSTYGGYQVTIDFFDS